MKNIFNSLVFIENNLVYLLGNQQEVVDFATKDPVELIKGKTGEELSELNKQLKKLDENVDNVADMDKEIEDLDLQEKSLLELVYKRLRLYSNIIGRIDVKNLNSEQKVVYDETLRTLQSLNLDITEYKTGNNSIEFKDEYGEIGEYFKKEGYILLEQSLFSLGFDAIYTVPFNGSNDNFSAGEKKHLLKLFEGFSIDEIKILINDIGYFKSHAKGIDLVRKFINGVKYSRDLYFKLGVNKDNKLSHHMRDILLNAPDIFFNISKISSNNLSKINSYFQKINGLGEFFFDKGLYSLGFEIVKRIRKEGLNNTVIGLYKEKPNDGNLQAFFKANEDILPEYKKNRIIDEGIIKERTKIALKKLADKYSTDGRSIGLGNNSSAWIDFNNLKLIIYIPGVENRTLDIYLDENLNMSLSVAGVMGMYFEGDYNLFKEVGINNLNDLINKKNEFDKVIKIKTVAVLLFNISNSDVQFNTRFSSFLGKISFESKHIRNAKYVITFNESTYAFERVSPEIKNILIKHGINNLSDLYDKFDLFRSDLDTILHEQKKQKEISYQVGEKLARSLSLKIDPKIDLVNKELSPIKVKGGMNFSRKQNKLYGYLELSEDGLIKVFGKIDKNAIIQIDSFTSDNGRYGSFFSADIGGDFVITFGDKIKSFDDFIKYKDEIRAWRQKAIIKLKQIKAKEAQEEELNSRVRDELADLLESKYGKYIKIDRNYSQGEVEKSIYINDHLRRRFISGKFHIKGGEIFHEKEKISKDEVDNMVREKIERYVSENNVKKYQPYYLKLTNILGKELLRSEFIPELEKSIEGFINKLFDYLSKNENKDLFILFFDENFFPHLDKSKKSELMSMLGREEYRIHFANEFTSIKKNEINDFVNVATGLSMHTNFYPFPIENIFFIKKVVNSGSFESIVRLGTLSKYELDINDFDVLQLIYSTGSVEIIAGLISQSKNTRLPFRINYSQLVNSKYRALLSFVSKTDIKLLSQKKKIELCNYLYKNDYPIARARSSIRSFNAFADTKQETYLVGSYENMGDITKPNTDLLFKFFGTDYTKTDYKINIFDPSNYRDIPLIGKDIQKIGQITVDPEKDIPKDIPIISHLAEGLGSLEKGNNLQNFDINNIESYEIFFNFLRISGLTHWEQKALDGINYEPFLKYAENNSLSVLINKIKECKNRIHPNIDKHLIKLLNISADIFSDKLKSYINPKSGMIDVTQNNIGDINAVLELCLLMKGNQGCPLFNIIKSVFPGYSGDKSFNDGFSYIVSRLDVEEINFKQIQNLEQLRDLLGLQKKARDFRSKANERYLKNKFDGLDLISIFTKGKLSETGANTAFCCDTRTIEEMRQYINNNIDRVTGDRFIVSLGANFLRENSPDYDNLDLLLQFARNWKNIKVNRDVKGMYNLISNFAYNKIVGFLYAQLGEGQKNIGAVRDELKKYGLNLKSIENELLKNDIPFEITAGKGQKTITRLAQGKVGYVTRKSAQVLSGNQGNVELGLITPKLKNIPWKKHKGVEVLGVIIGGQEKAKIIKVERNAGSVKMLMNERGMVNMKNEENNNKGKLIFSAPLAFTTGNHKMTEVAIKKGEIMNYLISTRGKDGFVISDQKGDIKILNKTKLKLSDFLDSSNTGIVGWNKKRFEKFYNQTGELEDRKLDVMNNLEDFMLFIDFMRYFRLSMLSNMLLIENGKVSEFGSDGADSRRFFVEYNDGSFGVIDSTENMSTKSLMEISVRVGIKNAVYMDTGMYDKATFYDLNGKKYILGHLDTDESTNRIVIYLK